MWSYGQQNFRTQTFYADSAQNGIISMGVHSAQTEPQDAQAKNNLPI